MMGHSGLCECAACQQGYAAVGAPWVETPWWHPYRWFGLDMRQRIRLDQINGERESCWWHYGRSQRLAHDLLRRQYESPQS